MAEIAFNNPLILSGVKKVLFTPWGADDTLDLTGDRYDLQNLVGDTVSVTQDDNDVTEIPSETRDEPLYEAITLGKYQVTMESGDINPELLAVCMGYAINAAKTIAYAPSSYSKKFAHIEIVLNGMSFVIPRVQLSPKQNIETLKTGIARGTIAGTAYSVDIATTSGKKRATPFFTVKAGAEPGTISMLGQGAGEYEDATGSLAVAPASVSFAAAGGTKIAYVSGNGSTVPTLTIPAGAQVWLSATFDNGAIAITAGNNSGSARTSKVTVTVGEESKEIAVSQSNS